MDINRTMDTPQTAQLLNRLRMRQVALLLAIGEHGTLRAAAAQLGMTQPAATKMLADIEEILGTRLFERLARGNAIQQIIFNGQPNGGLV